MYKMRWMYSNSAIFRDVDFSVVIQEEGHERNNRAALGVNYEKIGDYIKDRVTFDLVYDRK